MNMKQSDIKVYFFQYICVKPCARLRKGCSTAHHCRLSCCEDCEPCTEIVIRELPCKHQIKLQCETDILQHKCQVKVSNYNYNVIIFYLWRYL